jgi:hypothetical protein
MWRKDLQQHLAAECREGERTPDTAIPALPAVVTQDQETIAALPRAAIPLIELLEKGLLQALPIELHLAVPLCQPFSRQTHHALDDRTIGSIEQPDLPTTGWTHAPGPHH